MILQSTLRSALQQLGLEGKSVCVHSSIKSFGDRLENGFDGLLSSFLDCGCTVMAPTFSKMFMQQPDGLYQPEQNGTAYGDEIFATPFEYAPSLIYSPDTTQIATIFMGAFPTYLVQQPGRVRGAHPINSFTAIGPKAHQLIDGQTWRNVYAPFEALIEDDGYILLLGVHLDHTTLIHYAEQQAGRTLLVRWANNEKKQVQPCFIGTCSVGFQNFYPYVQDLETQITVGNSLWRCFKAKDLAERCTQVLRDHPEISHCGDPSCLKCNHMALGGPILPADFWEKGGLL